MFLFFQQIVIFYFEPNYIGGDILKYVVGVSHPISGVGSYKEAIKKRLCFLEVANPPVSLMFKLLELIPFGNFQSKWSSRRANRSSILAKPNEILGKSSFLY